MTKCQKTAIRLILPFLGFILVCRFYKGAADFYALTLYPVISSALSRLASLTVLSLTEITAIVLILALLVLWVTVLLGKMRPKRALWDTVIILSGAMVWIYMGWGVNYFRSDLYQRRHVTPSSNQQALKDYLAWYSQALKESLSPSDGTPVDRKILEEELRDYFQKEGHTGGLCAPKAWQHPKRLLLEDLYAGVGVLGYVGPFFAEHQVSGKLLDMEYPFTLAHELSHVLGVSEEAEANYWGFAACMASEHPSIRYSALQGVLSQTLSAARSCLGDQAFQEWKDTLPSKALEDLKARQDHWRQCYWPLLGSIQEWIYDLFLKGNQIKEGTANYGQVISMILTFEKERLSSRQ